MLLDAREIPGGTTLAADVCVIGAGAAGITLAPRPRGVGAFGAAARERRLRLRRPDPGPLPRQDRRPPHRSDDRHGTRLAAPALLRRHDQPLVGVLPAVPRARLRGAQLRAAFGVADRARRPRSVLRGGARRGGARPVRLLPRVLARPGTHRPTALRGPAHAALDRAAHTATAVRARVPRRDRQLDRRAARPLGERHPDRPRRRRQLRHRRRRDDPGQEPIHRDGQGVRRRHRRARGATIAPRVERPAPRGHRQRARPRGSVLHGARQHLGRPRRAFHADGLPQPLRPDTAHDRRRRRAARGRAPSRAARRPRGHAATGAAGVRGHARIPVRARRQAAAIDLPERDTRRRPPPRRGRRRADRGFGAGAL